MNVTYKDLKEGYILNDYDEIVIHGACYRVQPIIGRTGTEYYIAYEGVNNDSLDNDRIPKSSRNDFIFRILHIPDKDSFVKDIVGKDFSGVGCCPQVKTLKALTKVAISLLEEPLYKVGDYVTVRDEIEGYKYSLYYLSPMRELAGKTFYVTKVEEKDSFDNITDGEIYQYKLNCDYWWDIAMIMSATEEEKKSAGASDKKESEKKKEKKMHYVTLEDLKGGYVLKKSDHIRINSIDCVIYTSTSSTRFWLSSNTVIEKRIYDCLGIPEDKKKELAKLCGAADLNFDSPEFSSLEDLSNFVKKILMYKKEDEIPSEKKWSGNPTYFDLKNGRILKKGDILNIHGIGYRVIEGCSDKHHWLAASGVVNSIIFEKLGIEDKESFVRDICPIVDYGDFPEVGSYEDLTKVAIALYEVPEFKVGDKVKVAHREGNEEDYPEFFTYEMTKLEGNEYTITKVKGANLSTFVNDKSEERLNKDPNIYYLDGEASEFDWHSSMLEKVSESDKKLEEFSKEDTVVKPFQVSLSDLQSGYILKGCDIICLCGERYRVISGDGYCFLSNISGVLNHSVFDKLGITDKENFCSSYGTVSCGDFPKFNRLDALTACVKQLMLLESGLFELDLSCKGDSGDTPLPEVIKAGRLNFAMDISESDKPSNTGTVRLPEIKDDFKIIL